MTTDKRLFELAAILGWQHSAGQSAHIKSGTFKVEEQSTAGLVCSHWVNQVESVPSPVFLTILNGSQLSFYHAEVSIFESGVNWGACIFTFQLEYGGSMIDCLVPFHRGFAEHYKCFINHKELWTNLYKALPLSVKLLNRHLEASRG